MRLQHWLASVLGVLAVLTASSNLHAQGVPAGYAPADPGALNELSGHGSNRPPSPGALPGGGHFLGAGPYGTEIPSSHQLSVAPPGSSPIPPNMNPFPAISPFENRFRETYNTGGLWFDDTNNEADQQFFSASIFLARLNKPGSGIVGNPTLQQSDGVVLGRLGQFVSRYDYFDLRAIADNEHLKTEGLMLRWGVMRPDQTGVVADAFWASDYGVTNGLYPGIPTNVSVMSPPYVIGANNGTNNRPVSMNRFVNLYYDATAAGTSISFLNAPFWNLDHLKVRTIWGARYNFIRESMFIYGQDQVFLVDTEKSLHARTRSNLFGPEAGLQIDLGGKYLKFISRTKVGVLGNFEETKLWGDNFGGLTDVIQASPNTAFASSRTAVHISPSIEQNVHFETRLFHYIPYVNRIPYMDRAAFRFGYNYMLFGQVQRPNSSINYQSLPLFPTIKTDRHDYRIMGWDLGLTFDY